MLCQFQAYSKVNYTYITPPLFLSNCFLSGSFAEVQVFFFCIFLLIKDLTGVKLRKCKIHYPEVIPIISLNMCYIHKDFSKSFTLPYLILMTAHEKRHSLPPPLPLFLFNNFQIRKFGLKEVTNFSSCGCFQSLNDVQLFYDLMLFCNLFSFLVCCQCFSIFIHTDFSYHPFQLL